MTKKQKGYLIGLELRRGSMLHGGSYGGNSVVVGPALEAREHGRINLGLVVVVDRLSAPVNLLTRWRPRELRSAQGASPHPI
jgi:hypothetical protein